MVDCSTLDEILAQTESALGDLEQEITDYKQWAMEWSSSLSGGPCPKCASAEAGGSCTASADDLSATAACGDLEHGVSNPSRDLAATPMDRVEWLREDRTASAQAVASFWARMAERSAESAASCSDESDAIGDAASDSASDVASDAATDVAELGGVPDCVSDLLSSGEEEETEPDEAAFDPGDMQSAIQRAREAAVAELESEEEYPVGSLQASAESGGGESDPSLGDADGADHAGGDLLGSATSDLVAPNLPTGEPGDDAEPTPQAESPEVLALDPESQKKLKLLRRLNPGKPDSELLEQLSTQQEESDSSKSGRKRRWFGR
jgi:hypothetical protein